MRTRPAGTAHRAQEPELGGTLQAVVTVSSIDWLSTNSLTMCHNPSLSIPMRIAQTITKGAWLVSGPRVLLLIFVYMIYRLNQPYFSETESLLGCKSNRFFVYNQVTVTLHRTPMTLTAAAAAGPPPVPRLSESAGPRASQPVTVPVALPESDFQLDSCVFRSLCRRCLARPGPRQRICSVHR